MKILCLGYHGMDFDVKSNIGLFYIVSSIKKYSSQIIFEYDFFSLVNNHENVDIVLMSYSEPYPPKHEEFIKIRKLFEKSVIIFGGYIWGYKKHIEFFGHDLLDYCDAVCNQPGEEAILQFIKAYEKGEWKEFLKEKKYFYCKDVDENDIQICDFDFNQNDESLLNDSLIKGRLIVSLSRGCPNNCTYCASKIIKTPIKYRSDDWINNFLENQTYKKIVIFDLCPFINKEYYMNFNEKAFSKGFNVSYLFEPQFKCYIENITSALDYISFTFDKLVYLYIDASSPRVLTEICNRKDLFLYLKDYLKWSAINYPNTKYLINFLIKFPTETANDLNFLYEYLRNLLDLNKNINLYYTTVVNTFYGTPLNSRYPNNIKYSLKTPPVYDCPEFYEKEYVRIASMLDKITAHG